MNTRGSADQGRVTGMLVQVKEVRDGTLVFDVVCRGSRNRVKYRHEFLLPPRSPLASLVVKGARVLVKFRKMGDGKRDRPVEIVLNPEYEQVL